MWGRVSPSRSAPQKSLRRKLERPGEPGPQLKIKPGDSCSLQLWTHASRAHLTRDADKDSVASGSGSREAGGRSREVDGVKEASRGEEDGRKIQGKKRWRRGAKTQSFQIYRGTKDVQKLIFKRKKNLWTVEEDWDESG